MNKINHISIECTAYLSAIAILAVSLLPTSWGCKSEGMSSGGNVNLMLRIQDDDDTFTVANHIFARMTDLLTESDLASLERELAYPEEHPHPERRSNKFRDSNGEWWFDLYRTNKSPEYIVPEVYSFTAGASGLSLDSYYVISSASCINCSQDLMMRLNKEQLSDTIDGLWESDPESWTQLTIEYNMGVYLETLRQAVSMENDAQVMMPVYTITLNGGIAEVKEDEALFYTDIRHLSGYEQCQVEYFPVIRGEVHVPSWCADRADVAH